MTQKRQIEIFSANCPLCEDTIERVNELACEVRILDMNVASSQARAKQLGVKSVPAVAVDGKLIESCVHPGIDEESLRNSGIGDPIL